MMKTTALYLAVILATGAAAHATDYVLYTTNAPSSTNPPAATSGLLVRYVNYDGTILSSQYVATNGNAVAPANPSHPLLTFQEWNLDGTGIVQDTDIGATYITTDGKTYAYLDVAEVTGLSNSLFVTKSDVSELTIAWGDGSTDLVTVAGVCTNVHNYPSNGQYVATLWISSGSGTYTLGTDATTQPFIGQAQTNRDMLTTLFIGSNVTAITTGGLYNAWSLSAVTIPTNVVRIGSYGFYQTFSLPQCTLPRGLTIVESFTFQNGSLRSVAIPDAVTSFGSTAFRSCTKLQCMAIPAGVTNIGTYGCANLYGIRSITLPQGLTTIAANGFQTLNQLTTLTVPTNLISIDATGLSEISGVRSLTIPAGVTNIAASAFLNMRSLRTMDMTPTNPPTLANINAFSGVTACKIYVPDASYDLYTNAAVWKTSPVPLLYIYPMSTKP